MLRCLLIQFLIKFKITTPIMYSQKNVRISQLKNKDNEFFDSKIMLRFSKTKIAKEEFYGVKKQ